MRMPPAGITELGTGKQLTPEEIEYAKRAIKTSNAMQLVGAILSAGIPRKAVGGSGDVQWYADMTPKEVFEYALAIIDNADAYKDPEEGRGKILQ